MCQESVSNVNGTKVQRSVAAGISTITVPLQLAAAGEVVSPHAVVPDPYVPNHSVLFTCV